MGLSFWDYRALLAGGATPSELRAFADDHDVRVAEIEVILGFDAQFRVGQPTPRWGPDWLDLYVPYGDEGVIEDLFAMADTFEARHVVAVGSWKLPTDLERASKRFGELCDRAARHDLQVAVEFMPGTSIPDLTTSIEVLARADRPNGGLCFDTWHFRMGGDDQSVIEVLPPDKITVLQIADGPAERLQAPIDPDEYFRTTLTERMLPGQGDFDLVGLMCQLAGRGIQPEVSVEVLSSTLAALDPDQAARTVAAATAAVLDAVVSVTNPAP